MRSKPIIHGRDHLEGHADPIPGLAGFPSGDTIDAVIANLSPAGWWKLNESSGTVAADSSGNGLDMTADLSAPLWGAPAGPPGEQAANFETGVGGTPGTGTYARVQRSWPPLTTDFTAGIFISRTSTAYSPVIGQGNPSRSSGKGWQIDINGTSDFPFQHVNLTAKGLTTVTSDGTLAASTWAMVAAVYQGTTWRLNINGVTQTGSVTGSYTPVASASPLWIGHDGGLGFNSMFEGHFVGSYAFLVPSALTAAQLLKLYNSAVLPGGADDGKALIANGLGGSSWLFPIEVTY
jgi:hypothetical protein